MDQHQLDRQAQEKAQIAACDSLTVIAQAKRSLYKGGGGSQADPWLEEALSRFDAQTRAGLGSTVPGFVSSGSVPG